jgi:hypothetical protein
MENITKQIRHIALELLDNEPEGIKYSTILETISTKHPNFNNNTIRGAIWNLDTVFPVEVYKPERGVFRLFKYKKEISVQPEQQPTDEANPEKKANVKEEDFYQPFADWLIAELEECTKAIKLGGNTFGDKW